jgi:hypothetical protein
MSLAQAKANSLFRSWSLDQRRYFSDYARDAQNGLIRLAMAPLNPEPTMLESIRTYLHDMSRNVKEY